MIDAQIDAKNAETKRAENIEYSMSPVSWREALRIAFPIWLLSRLWVFAWVYAGHWDRSPNFAVSESPLRGGYGGVSNWWLNPWTTYDTQWYFQIAQDGYNARSVVFFPLYPALLRLGGVDENAIALWGFALSNLCFALALTVFIVLTTRHFSLTMTKRAACLLAFFPTAAVWSALYTESLFLLLVLVAFLMLEQKRYFYAGLAALLVALTRNSGPILWIVFLIEYSMQQKIAPLAWRKRAVHIALLSLPLLGFIGFQMFANWRFDDARAMFNAQETFGRAWTWPWLPVWNEIVNLPRGDWSYVALINLWATLFGLYFVFRFWRKPSPSYSVFLLGIELSQLCLGYSRAPFTLGAIRYLSTTFPFVQRLSVWLEPAMQRPLGRFCIAGIVVATSAQTSYLFGQKVFLF